MNTNTNTNNKVEEGEGVILYKVNEEISFKIKKEMLTNENSIKIKEYLNSLDETHKCALKIAIESLDSSFNILKSNGYNEYIVNAP
jgi:hypothetical protein